MRVIILSTAFSGLTQRVLTELELLNHTIEQHYDLNEDVLRQQAEKFNPDVIICPYLTQRIPDDIWSKYICLIVHPGIEGDRGPSSLDWAIIEGAQQWGVTLLQANGNYDAGDIWGTHTFPMRPAPKLSIYKREVTEAAIKLIKKALVDIAEKNIATHSLDYTSPKMLGKERPLMKQADRAIAWPNNSTKEILRKLNSADSRPGVRGVINGVDIHMYGGVADANLKGEPGTIIAIYKDAICMATKDGAIWIRQLKCSQLQNLPPIKLPALTVLENIYQSAQLSNIPVLQNAPVIEDIKVEHHQDVAYVYFNFYNGASNTQQCIDLKNTVASLKQSAAKKIVLMGGEDFWNNGIHLNCIEASESPADESWKNINAINDLILEIINTPNQVTIAALRNNAGAGGAIMALACDQVIIRSGVVLNPHYKTMGLFGSEYWTYLLPKRVGKEKSHQLMEECLPMLADEALKIGFVDQIFDEDWDKYHQNLHQYCEQLSEVIDINTFLATKMDSFEADNTIKNLSAYRDVELSHMKQSFFDLASDYHEKRRAFVYKVKTSVSSACVNFYFPFLNNRGCDDAVWQPLGIILRR
ncbi:MAG: enoyl-CoA hydratase-related protein [Exilibacterium sp.]